jgi:hydroxymethylpyrimidine pyrophosphatase-like HAD family hydrolase
MTFEALATDYDGTLAHDGVVYEPTLAALRRARAAGLRLLMVTGRELSDLFNTFEHSSLFDCIVAENGAVVYDPSSREVEVLAPAPPPELLQRLTQARVPFSVGHSIVATVQPHEHQLLGAIRDLELEWHVIFNKGSVMALPADVTKASGLTPALKTFELSCQRTIGVGDAENDQAFLRACGVAVAVANALQSVKDTAHIVTQGARGDGIIELIDRLLAGEFDGLLLHDDGGAGKRHFKLVPSHPAGACSDTQSAEGSIQPVADGRWSRLGSIRGRH